MKSGEGFPFDPPIVPMEAAVKDELPSPPGWAYEPKWDGFRVVAWSGSPPRLDSRNAKPLLRYFPELQPSLEGLPEDTVVDGEVVVVLEGMQNFDALQNRVHPAASRVEKLSRETPAQLVAFDLLAFRGRDLRASPFSERRAALEALGPDLPAGWSLTPSTQDLEVGKRWFHEFESAGCDGIVAKRLNGRYAEGKRDMVKVKHRRSVDVVVGGYRLHKLGDRVGSLLLGLYDSRGQLHFIGHTSGLKEAEAISLLTELEDLRTEESFGREARRPGGESRWASGKDLSWIPVAPELVAQISYDQLTGERFRHATRLERWRPDKDPRDCTMDQLERPEGPEFSEVVLGE